MPVCKQITRKRRNVCIGDLDSLITIENRAIEPPDFDTVDFDETFTTGVADAWALIETVRGKTFFDGVSTEIDITHWIYINFDATVTAESWVKLDDGRRLDILRVENLDERSDFQLLECNDRGDKEASKA
jgi:SPP1 family predicted phage head-tail adaptor